MGLLADWQIRKDVKITPFAEESLRTGVVSFGLSSYGYDVRVADDANETRQRSGELCRVGRIRGHGDHAGVETEEQHADRAEGGGEADVKWGIGQREDQPSFADVLHPRADEGDALTDEEETEVAVGECPQPVASRSFGHCMSNY